MDIAGGICTILTAVKGSIEGIHKLSFIAKKAEVLLQNKYLNEVELNSLKNKIEDNKKELDILEKLKLFYFEEYSFEKISEKEFKLNIKNNDENMKKVKKRIKSIEKEIAESGNSKRNLFVESFLEGNKINSLDKDMVEQFVSKIIINNKKRIIVEWNLKDSYFELRKLLKQTDNL